MQQPSAESGSDGEPAHWEFYRVPGSSAKSPVAREFEKLPHTARAGLNEAMRRYQLGASRPGEVKSFNREGLIELRWRERNNPYRLIFKRLGSLLLALTAFYKNQEQTPRTDI